MLVGGPYTEVDGDSHTYGHTAARVMSPDGETDRVYDFGRYGATRGDYSAEGDGILQEWDHAFGAYMYTQNLLGRQTDGYTFPATECQFEAAVELMEARKDEAILENTMELASSSPRSEMRRYKLQEDYHGLNNNCTTLSADVLEEGRPEIELDDLDERQGRGMGRAEYYASKAVEGWPNEIFMPADINEVLKDVSGDDVMVENWRPTDSGVEHSVSQDPYRTCSPNSPAAATTPARNESP